MAICIGLDVNNYVFQLTHPSRGVAKVKLIMTTLLLISTHTPLARCGDVVMLIVETSSNFNSHTPREVWLEISTRATDREHFNSHTPREVWRKILYISDR